MDNNSRNSILLVDDEPLNLLALSKMLSPQYAVFIAKSGEQALKFIAERKPDLVLLDVSMPGMDGFSVLSRMKAEEGTRDIPVIFITGMTSEDDEEKGFLLGAVDYIKKPFKSAIVRARVNTHIQLVRQSKLTEDELARVLSLAEGSPQFMAFLSTDGRVDYLNPAASHVSGYSKSELASRGLEAVFGKEGLRRIVTEFLQSVGRCVNEFEMPVVRKDGSKRILNFSTFTAVLHGGKTGLGLIGNDITEMKKMQMELIEAKERTDRALIHEEYYSKAKSDFLSRMSHEMRTPMNAIVNMASLARTDDAERRRHCLDEIDKASGHLLGIIDNILDMTKIDAGGFELSARPFRFRSAMHSVIEQVSRQANEKKQKFESALDERIPDLLVADEGRMKQALLNLLSNAVKFTPPGGSIRLSAAESGVRDKRCSICFEVSDTGVGMSSEMQERLWNAFEQADNSISRVHGGTGLGLPITRHIVEKMGGNIGVESAPGQGTRFAFTVSVDFETCDVLPGKNEADGADVSLLEGKRILVVDDVEVNREIISVLLADVNVKLDTAADGTEAVYKFAQDGHDFILMDLHMPVMDGFEAACRIRTSGLAGADKVQIIAVTADTGGDIIEKCLASGMNDYLTKPVEFETLVGTLELHLK
ncbi:MAG: response regulator [Synergistaceae bacterium]|jgi:PAS domain S-box-containing protein|nr:response regulator [Synergistaceae bacterium]